MTFLLISYSSRQNFIELISKSQKPPPQVVANPNPQPPNAIEQESQPAPSTWPAKHTNDGIPTRFLLSMSQSNRPWKVITRSSLSPWSAFAQTKAALRHNRPSSDNCVYFSAHRIDTLPDRVMKICLFICWRFGTCERKASQSISPPNRRICDSHFLVSLCALTT